MSRTLIDRIISNFSATGLIALILLIMLFFPCSDLLASNSVDHLWTEMTQSNMQGLLSSGSATLQKAKVLSLDTKRLENILLNVPYEGNHSDIKINLPVGVDGFREFIIVESSVMQSGLRRQYPQIKTYSGRCVDDPTATVRFSYTPKGFDAIILTDKGTYFINPDEHGQGNIYLAFQKHDILFDPTNQIGMNEGDLQTEPDNIYDLHTYSSGQLSSNIVLSRKTYLIAIAVRHEFTKKASATPENPTIEETLISINRIMNKVNAIYERDLGIFLEIINDEQDIIYIDPQKDHFTKMKTCELADESQIIIKAAIGEDKYDVGHTFGTSVGGGCAQIGAVCRNGRKAAGYSGYPDINSVELILIIAHELGHQFGANHTFNGAAGSCDSTGQYHADTAFEPGGGSTIMAYPSNCEPPYLKRDDYFHSASISEIVSYITTGDGKGCFTELTSFNHAPEVSISQAGGFYIPKGTPFKLKGSATDVDGDILTYCWEEFDTGPQGDPNYPQGNAPLFRSFPPKKNTIRYFPSEESIMNNISSDGELKPSYARDLNFRLTVRDNNTLAGGVAYKEIGFKVTDISEPFYVNKPFIDPKWIANNQEEVTWDVAKTNIAPINCQKVNILFSSNNTLSDLMMLKENTPNDGSEMITVPPVPTNNGRIIIEAADNIFFNVNFSPITVELPSQNTLSAGGVLPQSGRADQSFEFSVIYQSSGNKPPDGNTVNLFIDNIAYPLVLNASDWTQGVQFSWSKNNFQTGMHYYYFSATQNGDPIRFPAIESRSFSVTPSVVGWRLAITDLRNSPAYLNPSQAFNVSATVHNNSNSSEKIYYNVPYRFTFYDPSGNYISEKSGTITQLGPGEVANLSSSFTAGTAIGTHRVTLNIFPPLDEHLDDNVASAIAIVGSTGPTRQWYCASGDSWIEMVANQTKTFNGYTYTFKGANPNANPPNMVIQRGTSYYTINAGDFREFNSGNDVVICQEVLTGTSAIVSFGTQNTGKVTFDPTQVSCLPGSTIQFVANCATEQFANTWPSFYRNATVEAWFYNLVPSNGNYRNTYIFNVPASASPGIASFYFAARLGSGNAQFLRQLAIEVLANPPQISSISKTNFSADDQLTITGSNLGSSGSVKFNTVLANSVSSWTNSQIICIVPENITSGNLTVVTSGGSSNPIAYTVTSPTGSPQIVKAISDQIMDAGSTRYIADLASIFWDPNGDDLIFNIQFSASGLSYKTDSLAIGKLYLQADDGTAGLVEVVIRAIDDDNHTASDTFNVAIQDDVVGPPERPILLNPGEGIAVNPINTEFSCRGPR